MKLLLLALATLMGQQSYAAYTHGYYLCTGIQVREGTDQALAVKSEIYVKLRADEQGNFELREFIGDLTLANNYSGKHGEFDNESYYGNFALSKIMNVKNYRPRVYLGHIKFADINANGTINSEGGMWGSFMLDMREGFADTIEAHYVFQAGDHRGGTVDFLCEASDFH